MLELLYETSNTQAYQALRSCNKRLRQSCDDVRPSISFNVSQKAGLEAFLKRLPHLRSVSVQYGGATAHLVDSLTSLHNILPSLNTLKLRYAVLPSSCTLERQISNAVLSWSSTLLHLKLHAITCIPSSKTDDGGLEFLSQLPALKALVLVDVSPRVRVSDIAGCTGLTQLKLRSPSVPTTGPALSMDLSSFSLLQRLSCSHYNVSSLKISGLKELRSVDCSNNSISELSLSSCPALYSLTCNQNLLTTLDMRVCLGLGDLCCGGNPLTSLEVSGCSDLWSLDVDDTKISALDLTTCTGLNHLNLQENQVRVLDLQGCKRLFKLHMGGSINLQSLDLTGLARLTTVSIGRSCITSLRLSGCPSLESVSCGECPSLEVLCMTGCSKLAQIFCRDSKLHRKLSCRQCAAAYAIDIICEANSCSHGVSLEALFSAEVYE